MSKSFGARLFIDPDVLTSTRADHWSASVIRYLYELNATHSGRCVLNFINSGSRSVVIWPYLDYSKKDYKNAFAAPDDSRKAGYAGRPMRRADNGELPKVLCGLSTGAGTSVHVRFTPWRWTLDGNRAATLLHELVHAAQQAYGVLYLNKLDYAFETQAEFDAILVENIYRSEKHLMIRRNHHGWDELKGPMVPLAAGYVRLVNSFRARTPRLARSLAAVDTKWNALRKGATGYAPPPGAHP